ncbi:hypothetical protein MC885_021661 [Smutsia gigantea]|nr:hypothetical protein MC885_021661 [Smutsia gigantea]
MDPVLPSAGTAGSLGIEDRGPGESERGPGACAGRRGRGVGGPGTGWRAGATVSPVGFSHRTQMRGIRQDPSEISRPGSGSQFFYSVIVEKVSGSQIVDIDKRKYLVPSDITVAQFMWIIRKRIQLPSEKAIFLFVDKTVPQSSLTMGQLYEKEKDEDGFLYVAYSGENTFGF